jgi:hypothetical protein
MALTTTPSTKGDIVKSFSMKSRAPEITPVS